MRPELLTAETSEEARRAPAGPSCRAYCFAIAGGRRKPESLAERRTSIVGNRPSPTFQAEGLRLESGRPPAQGEHGLRNLHTPSTSFGVGTRAV